MTLEKISFKGTNLTNTNFKNATFLHCKFSGATLSYTNFQGSIFEGCSFSGAHILGADFSETNQRSTNYDYANRLLSKLCF